MSEESEQVEKRRSAGGKRIKRGNENGGISVACSKELIFPLPGDLCCCSPDERKEREDRLTRESHLFVLSGLSGRLFG